MRAVCLSDALALAALLKQTAAPEREAVCNAIFERAAIADRYARRLGRPHPGFGSGTLQAAMPRQRLRGLGPVDNPETCTCLILVLEHLRQRRSDADL